MVASYNTTKVQEPFKQECLKNKKHLRAISKNISIVLKIYPYLESGAIIPGSQLSIPFFCNNFQQKRAPQSVLSQKSRPQKPKMTPKMPFLAIFYVFFGGFSGKFQGKIRFPDPTERHCADIEFKPRNRVWDARSDKVTAFSRPQNGFFGTFFSKIPDFDSVKKHKKCFTV